MKQREKIRAIMTEILLDEIKAETGTLIFFMGRRYYLNEKSKKFLLDVKNKVIKTHDRVSAIRLLNCLK